MRSTVFSDRVLRWFERHGRKDLPWQVPDPYAVWVSEIMLQQTQVSKVLDYYSRFMQRFPTLADLAVAKEDEVLALWSGLGYYNRARHLHRAARLCVEKHAGTLPDNLAALMDLPGIGRSTAGAILSLTGQSRQPILDGNVKRLFARHFLVEGDTGSAATGKELWALAEKHLPETRFGQYNQALMDLGATLCTRSRPKCKACPVNASCRALQEDRVAELPQKKARVASRRRDMFVVLLVSRRRNGLCVFLQQRGADDIWPSLWFPPVFESAGERRGWQKGSGLPEGRSLPVLAHTLSHRRLRLHVERVCLEDSRQGEECAPVPGQAEKIPGQWVGLADLPDYAHPRALTKVLRAAGLAG